MFHYGTRGFQLWKRYGFAVSVLRMAVERVSTSRDPGSAADVPSPQRVCRRSDAKRACLYAMALREELRGAGTAAIRGLPHFRQ